MITGCVAWLTSTPVLDALAKVPRVQLIVQKEDFLRPDGVRQSRGNKWHRDLRERYARLHGISWSSIPRPADGFIDRLFAHNRLRNDFSRAIDKGIEPVRCLGESGSQPGNQAGAFRMHHKFLVRYVYHDPRDCKPESESLGDLAKFAAQYAYLGSDPECQKQQGEKLAAEAREYGIIPESVWTGSFNPTSTASRSLENAVIVKSKKIAQRYAEEWAWAMQFTEPLDWNSKWVSPEYIVAWQT